MTESREMTIDQLAEELSPTDYFVRVKGKKVDGNPTSPIKVRVV